jgi:hypothetical protein
MISVGWVERSGTQRQDAALPEYCWRRLGFALLHPTSEFFCKLLEKTVNLEGVLDYSSDRMITV